MRAVIQRVLNASVTTESTRVSNIGKGMLILVGFGKDETIAELDYIAKKCIDLRIFNDSNGIMNVSLPDIKGEALIVSQFTLYGDVRKGKRPSYFNASSHDTAKKLYYEFLDIFKSYYTLIKTGVFGADMQVSLVNDGPVTILLDSKKEF